METSKTGERAGVLVTAYRGDVWMNGYLLNPSEARAIASLLQEAAVEAMEQRQGHQAQQAVSDG